MNYCYKLYVQLQDRHKYQNEKYKIYIANIL